MISAIMHVIRFELMRTLSVGRLITWFALASFPSLLVGILRWQSDGRVPEFGMALVSYLLVPQISCMLGLLLWATPAIGSEIESQGWIYLRLRQHGRTSVPIGKYVVTFLWVSSYGLLSAIGVSFLSGHEHPWELARTLAELVLLSAACYGALYLAIGACAFRRATVVAVVYSLVVEGIVSWIPATVNQFTVSYRLRTLLMTQMHLDSTQLQEDLTYLFGSESSGFNVLCLLIYAIIGVTLAVTLSLTREYPVQAEV